MTTARIHWRSAVSPRVGCLEDAHSKRGVQSYLATLHKRQATLDQCGKQSRNDDDGPYPLAQCRIAPGW
jgi:hypothetical protein